MLLTKASGDLSWQIFASELVDSQSACPLPARRAAFGFGRPGRKDPDDPRPAIADVDAGLLPRAPRPVRVQLPAFEREVEEG